MLTTPAPDVIYSVGMTVFHPFNDWWPKARLITVSNPEQIHEDENGIMVLWGGEDIHPSLYGHNNAGSRVQPRASNRDIFETKCYNRAIRKSVPTIGVCRGAQLSCALIGGVLIQDVEGHEQGQHMIDTWDEKRMWTSSVHHQMMFPKPDSFKLVAWASPSKSKYYQMDNMPWDPLDVEPEILYFPEVKTLAIQGHPEYHGPHEPFNKYIRDIIENGLPA